MYKKYYKRLLVFIIAFILLILFSPVLFILTIILFIINKGKPFYIHSRPGRYSNIFTVIKFKTMNDNCDTNGQLLPDFKRCTLIGRYIRSLSLDELPQLINVLIGDMSLIGPRPLLITYLPLYNQQQIKRHDVRPGMTGWAQINGRNTLSWEERFDLDVWYVENISFLLDLRIFFITLFKVIKREGINSDSQKTMHPFLGNFL